jgi:hypothetical protein
MQAISVDAVLEEVDALLSADAFADRRVVSADS